VEPRHALRERHLGDTGERRCVLVELEHQLRRDAVSRSDLVDPRRPGVGREPLADPLGLRAGDARVTAAACSGPSTRPARDDGSRVPTSSVAVTTWSSENDSIETSGRAGESPLVRRT
jgi:hypothetical protein